MKLRRPNEYAGPQRRDSVTDMNSCDMSPTTRSTSRRSSLGTVGRLLKYTVLAVYLFLVLVFLVSYAAAFLPPLYFWWAGLPASFLTYQSVLVIVLGLGVWLRLRGRWIIPLVVAIILVTIRFVPLSLFTPQPAPSDEDLVLMTFNAPVRGPTPDALRQATLRLVRREQPDVLALQEPILWRDEEGRQKATPHLQAILDSLGYAAAPVSAGERRRRLRQPIVAAFPLQAPRQIILRARTEQEDPGYVTRVRFTWKGRPVVLYNLHLNTTGAVKPWHDTIRLHDTSTWLGYLRQYRDAYLRRAWEVRQVREMIESEDLPVLVAGDFNSTFHHWEYRHLAAGLTSAFMAGGRGWGATYHARLPLVRIDHILAGPEWEIVSAHVPDTPSLSDHRPVVARLRWRGESSTTEVSRSR